VIDNFHDETLNFSVVATRICVPLIQLLPVFLFDHISQPAIKGLEVYFPINAFLLGVDLFQDYLNAGELLNLYYMVDWFLPNFKNGKV
jgi:hypothetical protein